MKFLFFSFAGLAAALLSGCSMTPKENYQQEIDSDFAESTVLLRTLNVLDSGDVAKTRNTAMIPVFINLDSVRRYAVTDTATLTPQQREEWTKLARETLDYMNRHRDDWDSRRMDVRSGLRGLRHFLTDPEDVRALDELTDYLVRNEQKKSETPKP